jgi:hypothetical protein
MKITTCSLKIQWKADLYPEHLDCACYYVSSLFIETVTTLMFCLVPNCMLQLTFCICYDFAIIGVKGACFMSIQLTNLV